MRSLKVRNTVLTGIAAVILLILATSPFWTLVLVKREASAIVNDSLRSLVASSLANINISDGFMELTVALTTNDASVQEVNLQKIGDLTIQTTDLLKKYEESLADSKDRANFDRLVQRRAAFNSTRQKIIEFLKLGKRDDAVSLFNQKGLGEFREYKQAVDETVRADVDEARLRGSQILKLCNTLMIFQGILLLFFCIYAFLVPMLTLLERLITGDVVKDI